MSDDALHLKFNRTLLLSYRLSSNCLRTSVFLPSLAIVLHSSHSWFFGWILLSSEQREGESLSVDDSLVIRTVRLLILSMTVTLQMRMDNVKFAQAFRYAMVVLIGISLGRHSTRPISTPLCSTRHARRFVSTGNSSDENS